MARAIFFSSACDDSSPRAPLNVMRARVHRKSTTRASREKRRNRELRARQQQQQKAHLTLSHISLHSQPRIGQPLASVLKPYGQLDCCDSHSASDLSQLRGSTTKREFGLKAEASISHRNSRCLLAAQVAVLCPRSLGRSSRRRTSRISIDRVCSTRSLKTRRPT